MSNASSASTLKLEQSRFVESIAVYYQNSELDTPAPEAPVDPNAPKPPGDGGVGVGGGNIPGAAKANKTIAARTAKNGPATVTKAAMSNLKKPNNQRT